LALILLMPMIDGVIVKSDAYAPTSNDTLSNIVIEPLVSVGDTEGIILLGATAPLSDIVISTALIRSPSYWGVQVLGNPDALTSLVTLSGITVGHPAGGCVYSGQYASAVSTVNLICNQ
jgi:hypothetical protein